MLVTPVSCSKASNALQPCKARRLKPSLIAYADSLGGCCCSSVAGSCASGRGSGRSSTCTKQALVQSTPQRTNRKYGVEVRLTYIQETGSAPWCSPRCRRQRRARPHQALNPQIPHRTPIVLGLFAGDMNRSPDLAFSELQALTCGVMPPYPLSHHLLEGQAKQALGRDLRRI